jgi:carbonic anhydrase
VKASTFRCLSAAVLPVLILAAAHAADPQKPASVCPPDDIWGYHSPIGPENWATLSPCYTQCDNAGEQSPIDIVGARRAPLPPLEFSYGMVNGLQVEHNGHSIEATVPAQTPAGQVTLRIQGVDYRLQRFHFHTPSEHKVGGSPAEMELHLVHEGPGGRTVAVGVFIQGTQDNAELSKIFDRLPQRKCERITVPSFNLQALLPASRTSYRYAGSLTTPSCGQGLQWVVLTSLISIKPEQVAAFRSLFWVAPLFPDGNSRPVQELNGRPILMDVP